MRTRPRTFGSLLGIVGAYLAHEGIYHLMLTGSCSTPAGPGEVPCPPGTEQHFFLLFGGIVLCMAAIFVGGSWLAFISLFVAIGVGAIRSGLSAAAADDSFGVFFGICFLIGPAIMLLTLPFVGLKRMRAARLLQHGAHGTGTVLAVEDTGVLINNNPRLRMTFRIEPADGITPPFEATKTATISRFELPRVGERYPVWFDPENPSKWMFATNVPDSIAAQHPGLRKIVELAKQGARQPVPPPDSVVHELNRLNELHLTGKISAEEFASRTSQLLRT